MCAIMSSKCRKICSLFVNARHINSFFMINCATGLISMIFFCIILLKQGRLADLQLEAWPSIILICVNLVSSLAIHRVLHKSVALFISLLVGHALCIIASIAVVILSVRGLVHTRTHFNALFSLAAMARIGTAHPHAQAQSNTHAKSNVASSFSPNFQFQSNVMTTLYVFQLLIGVLCLSVTVSVCFVIGQLICCSRNTTLYIVVQQASPPPHSSARRAPHSDSSSSSDSAANSTANHSRTHTQTRMRRRRRRRNTRHPPSSPPSAHRQPQLIAATLSVENGGSPDNPWILNNSVLTDNYLCTHERSHLLNTRRSAPHQSSPPPHSPTQPMICSPPLSSPPDPLSSAQPVQQQQPDSMSPLPANSRSSPLHSAQQQHEEVSQESPPQTVCPASSSSSSQPISSSCNIAAQTSPAISPSFSHENPASLSVATSPGFLLSAHSPTTSAASSSLADSRSNHVMTQPLNNAFHHPSLRKISTRLPVITCYDKVSYRDGRFFCNLAESNQMGPQNSQSQPLNHVTTTTNAMTAALNPTNSIKTSSSSRTSSSVASNSHQLRSQLVYIHADRKNGQSVAANQEAPAIVVFPGFPPIYSKEQTRPNSAHLGYDSCDEIGGELLPALLLEQFPDVRDASLSLTNNNIASAQPQS